jgi:sugar-phosphatase
VADGSTTDLVLPCRALLLDCDGVLVDSDAAVHRSWSRWARRYGLDPDAVTAVVHGRRSADTVAALLDPERRDGALAAIDRFEVEDAAGTPAIPGARALLTALPPGSWAVVTSGRRELATARLVAAGLPVPAVAVCAEDVPSGKPDPAGYQLAAERLGVDPAACVVVEDSPAGIAAGRAAGATVLGVGERALGSPAAAVVRDLTGLTLDDDGLHVPAGAVLGR